MPSSPPEPGDDRRHPPGPGQGWAESWYFDLVDVEAGSGGYVWLTLYPALDRATYRAWYLRGAEPPVVVVEDEVELPGSPTSLQVRAPALWADHNCEEPIARWSLGLETFGLLLDDPRDAWGDAGGEVRGRQIPFGFELEWEQSGAAAATRAPEAFASPPTSSEGLSVPCEVHGEVLVGSDELEVTATGHRWHCWGTPARRDAGGLWAACRLDDGTRLELAGAPPRGRLRAWAPDGGPDRGPDETTVELGLAGSPSHLDVELNWSHATVSGLARPLAWAPTPVWWPDGGRTRLARALVRVELTDGRSGGGWLGVQPPDR